MVQPLIDRAMEINGWMLPDELGWLASQASKSKVIIEIGCHHGRSTRALADSTEGVVFAVDPWDNNYYWDDGRKKEMGDDSWDRFNENLADHIQSGKVIPVRSYSKDAILPKADFIFIDGDHRYESVKFDIELAEDLIMLGGVISGHDYGYADWPGVKAAVDSRYQNIQRVSSIWIVQK